MNGSRPSRAQAGLAAALIAAGAALGAPAEPARAIPVGPITTVRPPEIYPDCVLGDWQVADLQAHLKASIPADVTVDKLTVSGAIRMSFSDAGQWTQSYDRVTLRAEARYAKVVQEIDGFIAASYGEASPGVLLFAGQRGSVTVNMSVNGQSMSRDVEIGAGPDGLATPSGHMNYGCEGDSLTLTTVTAGQAAPPLVLARCGATCPVAGTRSDLDESH